MPLSIDFSELYRATSPHVSVSVDGKLLATAVEHRLVVRDAETLQIAALFSCSANVDVVAWAADSQLVAVASKAKKCAQIWSIVDPDWKCCIDEGVSGLSNILWSPDARHLLVFSDFQLRITHFPVETTDLEDIAWSPDGRFIAVWDTILEYKVLIYSPDGRLISSFSAYENGLGIKGVSWSPSAQFLAVGSFDEKEVYKEATWKDPKDTSRLKTWSLTTDVRPRIHYELVKPPVHVSTVKVEIDKLSPKKGVSVYNMPNALWIWDLLTLSQAALLLQLSPIKQVAWNPMIPDLCAVSCANSYIYLWSRENGCNAVEVPAINFQVGLMKWGPDGKSLVLMDRDKFCVAFLVQE
ncbi:WD repeat-containing protein wrap73 [Rhizoclosmatium sp. JEL0117]|nr:WD repeat-containing protein wrap73 [Rhizoclosmatium sp. JEL0117]